MSIFVIVPNYLEKYMPHLITVNSNICSCIVPSSSVKLRLVNCSKFIWPPVSDWFCVSIIGRMVIYLFWVELRCNIMLQLVMCPSDVLIESDFACNSFFIFMVLLYVVFCSSVTFLCVFMYVMLFITIIYYIKQTSEK